MPNFKLFRNTILAMLVGVIPSSASRDHGAARRHVPSSGTIFLSANAPQLREERLATLEWRRRLRPSRRIADVVCLVPDLATFLEAVSAWDSDHWFPILIEGGEGNGRFLRAFGPARIVRFPAHAPARPAEDLWRRALASVARSRPSWSAPGVVVSTPDSPMLAAAVALAAGHGQPLLRWEAKAKSRSRITEAEAKELAAGLASRIKATVPDSQGLGDDCDFLTLAGDYPFRYQSRVGDQAFDDLVGRSADGRTRWAYPGRLVGTASQAVYQAMCSLFLQPDDALLFNTYKDDSGPWRPYTMRPAALVLSGRMDVRHRSGDRDASLAGWHQAFRPINRYGLVMINSGGYPTLFHLRRRPGLTGDVPASVPTVVWNVHSHSAADPYDPETIAGRWLANGAFVYFGSMNEPYLQSFRTPTLIASLLVSGEPMAAAVRPSPAEPYSFPWRLVYLGDPLFQLRPLEPGAQPSRTTWAKLDDWPGIAPLARVPRDAPEADQLDWALSAYVASFERRSPPDRLDDAATTLLGIRPERLTRHDGTRLDVALADLLERPEFRRRTLEVLADRPAGSLSAVLKRALETARVADLQHALSAGDFEVAGKAWDAIVRSDSPEPLKAAVTDRMAELAGSAGRLEAWRDRLRQTLNTVRGTPGAAAVEAERRRVEALLAR